MNEGSILYQIGWLIACLFFVFVVLICFGIGWALTPFAWAYNKFRGRQ